VDLEDKVGTKPGRRERVVEGKSLALGGSPKNIQYIIGGRREERSTDGGEYS